MRHDTDGLPNEPRAGVARAVAIPSLFELYGEQLYALGLRILGDAETARDIVQETFLLAYRKWDQFQGLSRASTWLYTIAARLCQRQLRQSDREPGRMRSLEELSPFGEITIAAPLPTDDLETREERAAVLREVEGAIARLPAMFRIPLVLKEIGGLSLAEVASALDVRVETIKTRLHRARLAVRKDVESSRPQLPAPPPI